MIVNAKPSGILSLGRTGENQARSIRFDVSHWVRDFGPGVVELVHQRSGDPYPYPVVVSQDGNEVTWNITATDTAAAGTGSAELQYYVGDTLAKSETWMTKVFPALGPAAETPPDPYQSWVDQVLQAGTVATEAAEKAANAAVRQPIVGGNGNWWTWDLEAGAYVDTGIYSGGDAPYIGDNGNWYVGQTDTGVAATGPAGPVGPEGPEGPAGTTGPAGPHGPQGEPGPQGPEGPTGPTGATGPQGPKGDKGDQGEKGDTGAQGPKGDKGDTGAQGPKGDKGDTGERGPIGETGAQGPAGPALAVTNAATVGQTIRVSAVDENGQPTEWEAVDMESGGNIVYQETILASGTISASDTSPYKYIETGLTIGDLKKWKRFACFFTPGTNCYCRMKFPDRMLLGSSGVRPISIFEWADRDQTILECVFKTGADGYFTSIDDQFVIASTERFDNKLFGYRVSPITLGDDEKVYVNVYSKIDNDVPWKIVGITKEV